MFKDASHYFILQMLNKDSKKVTPEIYEKLSEKGKTNIKVGDIQVAYFVQKKIEVSSTDPTYFEESKSLNAFIPELELRLEFTSLQNAIEEVASLKYVEFRKDIPVFEV